MSISDVVVGTIVHYTWHGQIKKGKIINFKHGVPNIVDIKT